MTRYLRDIAISQCRNLSLQYSIEYLQELCCYSIILSPDRSVFVLVVTKRKSKCQALPSDHLYRLPVNHPRALNIHDSLANKRDIK